MKLSSIHGIALIVGTLGMIVTMLFHPTGHDLLAPADEVARRNEMIAVAVHSLAIASQPVLVFGFLGLVRRLCWERPLVSGGMIVYSFGAVAGMCAAIASGFVAPLLTRQLLTAAGGERDLVQMALHYNGMVNQGFAKVFVVASFAAVLCWSASLLKVGEAARWIGITGCVIGAVSLLVFLSGHVRLNVHGFGLLVFVQSAWIILVGVWLIRRGD